MIKIYLDDKAMKFKKEIVEHVESELTHNCNFNGASHEIEGSEYTYIDGIDEIEGAILMNQIFDIINK